MFGNFARTSTAAVELGSRFGSAPTKWLEVTPASLHSRIKRWPWLPPNWLPSLRAARVLWHDYGHLATVRAGLAIDRDGNPLPWYTYPAIDYLRQLDFREKVVFEYGAGMSTQFWASVARAVVSVEDDERWFATLQQHLPANAVVTLEKDLADFPAAIHHNEWRTFDVIVVDGPARGRTRLKCCQEALCALRPGGLIILDNSDWLPESSRLLRESGLLQVDMTGFAPICAHVQTTSLFFDRRFDVAALSGRQPTIAVGGATKNWEQPFVSAHGEVVGCNGEAFRCVTDDLQFEIQTPDGSRTFRAITYLGGDQSRAIAILDVTRGRVLLTRHRAVRKGNGADLSREIARIASMRWDDFRAFIASHESRRYVL
jgi:hypothetical protein